MQIAREELLPLRLLQLVAAFLILSSPALSENRKNQAQQVRPPQQSRPVQAFHPVQQFRQSTPAFVQRQNTFAPPRTNPLPSRNFNFSGATGVRTYQPQRRTFGTAAPAAASGTRRFGQTNISGSSRRFGSEHASSGIHRFGTNGAPRRVAGGGHYTYHGRTFAAFQAHPYRWPHGYHYRRYVVGYALPHRFWTRDYYIDNFGDYALEPPPPDFEWVRYGPDILLVDLSSGQIAQVIYGAFVDAPPDDLSADIAPDQPSDQ